MISFGRRYKMIINAIIEQDDDGFFAYVPSLKGCVSQGDTFEETLANITEASSLYVESLKTSQRDSFIKNQAIIAPIEIPIYA
jgi:predicted RNase H-like HicB family nuclease